MSATVGVSDSDIEAFAKPIMRSRVDAIRDFAGKLQRKYPTPYDLQQKVFGLFREAEKRHGVTLVPLLRKLNDASDFPTANVFLSKGGSTTRAALEERGYMKYPGLAPFLRYQALISDDPRSGAERLGNEFGISFSVCDFLAFCRSRGDYETFGKAVSGTNPFEPGLPAGEKARRLELRVAYDRALDTAILKPADLDLLRGYRFTRARRRGFDTHPAPLHYLNADGSPAYAGWQEGPIIKMIEDGFLTEGIGGWPFSSSMILTRPIANLDDIQTLDSGELVFRSDDVKIPRNWLGRYDLRTDAGKREMAKVIQGVLKCTGDIPMIIAERYGLPLMMAVTKEQCRVEFDVRGDGMAKYELEFCNRPSVFILDRPAGGKNAFDLSKEGFDYLAEKLELK